MPLDHIRNAQAFNDIGANAKNMVVHVGGMNSNLNSRLKKNYGDGVRFVMDPFRKLS